jgi:RimJ/RimL family protein N-acetyltransferase
VRENGAAGFVLDRGGMPSGFLQFYNAGLVGGGWWPEESAQTYGMDLMLSGREKGNGAEVIRAFAAFIRQKHPEATSLIVDPDPKNIRAVKAFAKAGFRAEGEIQTPDGRALLMRMKL